MTPSGYSVRPPRADEAPAVAAIFADYDARQADALDTTADEIEEDWARLRFEREQDSWIVEAGEAPVAYASVWAERPHVDFRGDAVVHPDHWGRGIGALLVDLMEGRARETAAFTSDAEVLLHTVIPRSDGRGARLLQARGYMRVRTFLRMAVELDEIRGEPPTPSGISIQRLRRSRDERAFFDTMVEAFHGGWRSDPGPFDEWAHRLTLPDFDPSLWLLAWNGSEVAGALEGRPVDGELGWIKNLGVRPAYRRRGIGSALLEHSFAAFKQRGCSQVELGVDSANETRATALYERAGMRLTRSFDFYAKSLSRP
jgi:mycothiol synthase